MRVIRSQEHRHRAVVLWSAYATERSVSLDLFVELTLVHSNGLDALRHDQARIDGVHPDTARTQFTCEHAGYCVHCTFGRRIDRTVCRVHVAHHRTSVDDDAAAVAEALD